MMITSTAQAKKIIEVGMIVYTGADYIKVIETNNNDIKCIDVEYDEDIQDYREVGKPYYRTYTDFIKNEV